MSAFLLYFLSMNATELFFSTIQAGNSKNIILQLQNSPELVNARDPRGFTSLIFASYFGHDEIAKVLIERGADIDAKDASGNTALMGVCFKGNISMASFFLERGAAINVRNNDGITPLIFSCMYNKIESVKLLLENNADRNLKDQKNKTAMDYANENDFKEIKALLEKNRT
jgi:ankyrin repeat protein